MPVNVALILGAEATAQYHETGKIPSDTWLLHHSGEVWHRTYPDRRTYEAVQEAISKMTGQQDGTVVLLEETPEPGQSLLAKELRVFVWPYKLLPRNASDEEILKAWKNGHMANPDYEEGDDLYEIEIYTPDEFAEKINDEYYFYTKYVRFITLT